MPEPIDPIEPDPNPITEVRRITPTKLVIERTPRDPVTMTESYNIAELKASIAKDQGVVATWQAKVDISQAIIDEYDKIYAEENPPEEEIIP